MCFQCMEAVKEYDRRQAATAERQPEPPFESEAVPDPPALFEWPPEIGGEG